MPKSPFLAIKQVETQVGTTLRAVDVDSLEADGRRVVLNIKRLMVDTRLDIRDYELSETREEQLKYAHEGKKRLEQFRRSILTASEYNIFSAIDVAQLTAELDQIREDLL
ncbi:MAG: hypothetical protein WC498_03210 [Candidatus Saccharimonadales bacterium]